MLFVLKQSIMSGTVTVSTELLGIEANSFDDAKKIVKNLKDNDLFVNIKEDDEYLFF